MGPIVFLLAFLILAVWIGFVGGKRPEIWRRSFAVAVATSLPFQIWLVMWLRDAIVLGYGFGLEAESAFRVLRRIVDGSLGNAALAGCKCDWLLAGHQSWTAAGVADSSSA